MKMKTFCPFINDECRKDCTFHSDFAIALPTGGYATKCELMSFISLHDEGEPEVTISKFFKLLGKA